MVNKAVAEALELSQDELLKRSVAEIYGSQGDRDDALKLLEETGQLDNFDMLARRLGTGEEFWVSLNITMIDYKGEQALLTATLDITERKEAEEEIRLASERLLLLMDNSPLGSVVISLDREIQYASSAALKMFGYTADELLGRRARLFYKNPDDAIEINKRIDSGEQDKHQLLQMKQF